jgi:hypothetical protein
VVFAHYLLPNIFLYLYPVIRTFYYTLCYLSKLRKGKGKGKGKDKGKGKGKGKFKGKGKVKSKGKFHLRTDNKVSEW